MSHESTTSPFRYGLHHVQLAIPSGAEDACRAFYVEVLGMIEIPKPPILATQGGLWVRADGEEIHLGVEEDFRPARKAHPGLLVRDLDALAKRLEHHDVKIAWDDSFPGHRRFYTTDNLGNRLEFLEPEQGWWKLSSNVAAHCSSVTARKLDRESRPPTLFTSPSSRPYLSSTSSMTRCALSRSARSAAMPATPAQGSSPPGLRETPTAVAPSATSSRTVASPMPAEAPVTRKTFPDIRKSMRGISS